MEGNSHPYEMQQLIKRRALDQFIKMQKGSLYYTVEQLEKSGFIEIKSVIRDTNHPDKIIYTITESGKKEFHDLLLKEVYQPQRIYFPLHEVIAFMKHLNPDELIPAIRERIRISERNLEEFKSSYQQYEGNIPKFGMEIMASGIEYCQIELKLLNNILRDLEDGTYNNKEKLDDFKL
jgi:DNA-binding PadR family transcriptional regulator